MSLEALTCDKCGGQIDRTTLVCSHCNTAYKINHQKVLIQRQLVPDEVVLGAHTSFDPQYLRYDKENVLRYEIENLTYQLAQQLVPFMEVETGADLRSNMIDLYGRVKVLKNKGNLLEMYDDITNVTKIVD